MTIESSLGVTRAAATTTAGEQSSYVDWAAIIAGIVLASAVSVVFISFGSAIGLNFVDFNAREGASPIFIAIAAAAWFLWVQVSSFMAGGYLAGRLRRRFHDATEHESDVRDGAHGLLVWAGAVIVGTALALGGVGAAVNTAGSALSTAAIAGATAADSGEATDPNAYFIDTLFRSPQPANTEVARAEASRIFAQAALGDGTVAPEDRDYLVNVVAANTALSPEEANGRVDQVIGNIEQARQDALEAARTARNTGILGAFLLAASLLVSGIGAFWAAQKGGNHRDENTVFAEVFRRF